ncbi:hypothetical protein LZ31DRAFT_191231 [Colletotrichum somersetense]|nr:hypothetical protein LZ31DRAFT_191231 [Colletotrichum somersetense]
MGEGGFVLVFLVACLAERLGGSAPRARSASHCWPCPFPLPADRERQGGKRDVFATVNSSSVTLVCINGARRDCEPRKRLCSFGLSGGASSQAMSSDSYLPFRGEFSPSPPLPRPVSADCLGPSHPLRRVQLGIPIEGGSTHPQ